MMASSVSSKLMVCMIQRRICEAETGLGLAVRYILTVQPTSNRPTTTQRTVCSCLVNRFTRSIYASPGKAQRNKNQPAFRRAVSAFFSWPLRLKDQEEDWWDWKGRRGGDSTPRYGLTRTTV